MLEGHPSGKEGKTGFNFYARRGEKIKLLFAFCTGSRSTSTRSPCGEEALAARPPPPPRSIRSTTRCATCTTPCPGKQVSLGYFATAEEAALCVAQSPEGQAVAAERSAAALPLPSEEARQQARAEELTQLVALLVKEEEGEEECSDVRPKRPRAK